MAEYNQNSRFVTTFHAFPILEKGATLAGYSALIADHDLLVPIPDYLCAIGVKHKKYHKGRWRIFTPRHKPDDSLYGHLVFAFKYEGLDLYLLKALFDIIASDIIVKIVKSKPTGAYSRRIWFLYEWLSNKQLDIEDATQGNFVALVNDTLQYPGPQRDSHRHRIRNNLPGTCKFCPLIRRTENLA